MDKSQLKRKVNATGSYFFNRSSMKFFGDTMDNYYVPVDIVKINTYTRTNIECYELQRIRPVKHGLINSAYFDINTFERILPKKEN
jgi:hypothetical protein